MGYRIRLDGYESASRHWLSQHTAAGNATATAAAVATLLLLRTVLIDGLLDGLLDGLARWYCNKIKYSI